MVWYQVTPPVDTVMDVQVGVASGLSAWFAVNLASSQSGIFCASSGATTGRVTGSAFLQGGQSYSLVVGGNGTAFTLQTSFGTPLRAIAPGRRVRQRIGNLRRFRGRSFTIPAQAGQRYRVDLALSSRSRRFCERTDRGLWLDVWAPNPNPDVTEPAAVIERHCGGRAVFTARQTGSYVVDVSRAWHNRRPRRTPPTVFTVAVALA